MIDFRCPDGVAILTAPQETNTPRMWQDHLFFARWHQLLTSLGITPAALPGKKPRAERIRDLLENHLGHPLSNCPDCGAVDSLIRILLPPNARAPPLEFVYVAVK
jgi:hypothetical protein